MHKFHSNITSSSGQAYLENTTILQAEGADAGVFLQGQFSNDVTNLKESEACFAGLSNPKGRLTVNAYIYRKAQNTFWIVLPSSMLLETQKQLSKYVMRSKVIFSHRGDLNLYGLWNNSQENVIKFKDKVNLAQHANLNIAITTDKNNATLDSETSWELQKILNAIPEIKPETQEHFVAQMLNMDVLNGISFNKGCYTGQEIIARMQHLGRIKRRTLLISSQVELLPGEKLKYEDSAFAEVLNCIKYDGIYFCLAVVQVDKVKHYDANILLNDYGLVIYTSPYELNQDV